MKANNAVTGAPAAPARKIADILLEAEAMLRSAGITDVPRLEAEVLLADLLGIERAQLIASYGEPMKNRAEYAARLTRRMKGEPVGYIVGKKEFMGFTFLVDKRALIPRPETETLVGHAVEAAPKGSVTIADIGTGCGCIAVSLALLLPRATIHATDVSESALELARCNAGRHRVSERIIFHAGSACRALPQALRDRVDMIVSNPPYVSDAEYAALDKGIRNFEPAVALKGGADGLEVFRLIAGEAAGFLSSRGILAVEIGESQGEAAAGILQKTGSFAGIKTIRDLAGRTRVITSRKAR